MSEERVDQTTLDHPEPRTVLRSRGEASVSPQRLISVGYGNLVVASRVVAIVAPHAAPMRRLRREATERGKLIDVTEGRRTRSILITDSDHVVLSAINPETLAARVGQAQDGADA